MQKTLLTKLSIIVGLCIIFSIGLNMIGSIIYERQNYAAAVITEITQQHVNPQEVITPFIAIPTTVTPACQSDASDKKNKCEPSYSKIETIFATQTQAAQNLTVNTDTYKRGIYSATSYEGQLTFDQSYMSADNVDRAATLLGNDSESLTTSSNTDKTPLAKTIIHWNKAKLIIPVSDLRGVATLPTITINQKTIKAHYPQIPMIDNLTYVEVDIPKDVLDQLINPTRQQNKALIVTTGSKGTDTAELRRQPSNPKGNQALNIMVDLPLAGISNLTTVPTGQNFTLSMHSDWQTPNFIGKALPNTKSITAEGFDASWQNQYLTVANNQYLSQCISTPNHHCTIISEPTLDTDDQSYYPDNFESSRGLTAESATVAVGAQNVMLNSFGVSFASPNDVYLQTERAMKYALLLILVSFGTFFLFEVIKSSRIHPIQYLLVGCALFVFYVLLLPLAEQIAFWQAYMVAASACVGLIGWYSYYVFGGLKRAVIFTATLAGLYAAFFGILSTEDLNLLLGAIFCFVILACVMVMTRKLDWYKVT